VAVWVGFRVRGKVAPETVKPAPVRVAALTVTGALPVEERVTVWIAAVFTAWLPKARLDALTLSVGVRGINCNV
jgi:hypothetical protein